MAPALGWRSKLGIGPTLPTSFQLEFQDERLRFQETQSDLSGLRGTRGRPDARVRTTAGQPSGPIILQPTPRELDVVLRYITGGEKAGNTFPLAELLPEFVAQMFRDAICMNYTGCMINSATFQAASGGPLTLALDIVGKTEAVGAFPAGLAPIEEEPYQLADLTATIAGEEYQVEEIQIIFNNALSTRYFNSVTPTRINPTDRSINYILTLPYGDSLDVYGAGPVQVSASFTNGAAELSFLSKHVRAPRDTPTTGSSRDEILQVWAGTARLTAADPEVVVTNKLS